MHFRIISPNGFLKEYINYYWIMESDGDEKDMTERVIPTGNVQIMFHYGKPFIMESPEKPKIIQPKCILSGISNKWMDVTTNGNTGVFAVTFKTYGACHFFRFPLTEIEDIHVSLSDIFSDEIRTIEEKMGTLSTAEEKVKVVEDFLISKFTNVASNDEKLIKTGVDMIKRSKGRMRSVLLSENLSVTSKTLERKFSSYLGKTPKQIIKLIRFQEVFSELQSEKNPDLTDLTYKYGYYDQSHFIREFKLCSGLTPTDLLSLCACNEIVREEN